MNTVLIIVQHTPAWVFAILAAVTALGMLALRTRNVPLWRLLVLPAVFIVWGVQSAAQTSAGLLLDWAIAAAIGGAIGWLTTRLDGVALDRVAGLVRVPGSAVPLMRNLGIFFAKYGLTAAMALAPALHGSLTAWYVGVSGISAGYFIGWLARLALKYRAESRPALALPAA